METTRLYLRPFRLEDAMQLFVLAKDEELAKDCGFVAHTSEQDSIDVIKNVLWLTNNFALIEKTSGKLVGSCGLSNDAKRNVEQTHMLGYWIGRPFWGKGYATEGARAVLDFGFNELDCKLISVYHYGYNTKSKKVIEKLGFTYEGCLRRAIKRYDGEICDDVMHSMTKQEYNEFKRV